MDRGSESLVLIQQKKETITAIFIEVFLSKLVLNLLFFEIFKAYWRE